MFWFHHCTITENFIIHRAIWRTTPSSLFEPYVLFHTPHGGLRPSFRLVCLKPISFMWHEGPAARPSLWSNLVSRQCDAHLLCPVCSKHPTSSSRLIPGWLPTKQELQCDNVSFSVFIFQSDGLAVGRSEAYLFPPPDGWWLIMWQCVHPTSTALYSTSEIPLVFVEPPAWNRILYGSYLGSLKVSPNVIWFYLRFRSCVSFRHSSVSVKHSFLARLNWPLLLFIHISELFNDS